MSFSEFVASWQTFYASLAGVAATFAGLLFVSLSLHLELLQRPELQGAKLLARHAFASFVFLVVFSLVFLIPAAGPAGLGIPLLLTGLMALAQTLPRIREVRRARGTAPPVGARGIYLLSAVTYLAIAATALGVLLGRMWVLYAVVGLLIWHLAWTTRSAWDLLVELRVPPAGR